MILTHRTSNYTACPGYHEEERARIERAQTLPTLLPDTY